MQKPPTLNSLAAELCRKFPDKPSKTLARLLHNENKERVKDVESARSVIRKVRGNIGSPCRHQAVAGVVRPPGKSGWKPECPPSATEAWEPFLLESPSVVLSISDTHVPYHERGALESAVKYAKRRHKPTVLLLNGDYGDFYSLSKFEKDPSKIDFAYEAEVMEDGLSWLRGQFPKARFIYKLGNHDERLEKYFWNYAPVIWKTASKEIHEVLKFDKYGIERVNDQPIMAGHLPILHGHELQKSLGTPVNQARSAFLKAVHTVLVGHGHRTSTHCEPDMFHKEITTWSQGCLCGLSPPYARFNKWNLGFAVVAVGSDGQFDMHNYRLGPDFTVRTA